MKNIKMILVTLTMVISVHASAINSATSISTSWSEPAGSQIALPKTYTTTTTTTTTNATPLVSTVPQFNVKDVKVTADGKCQIIKNGSVVKTDVYSGSPCQKIYGTSLQAASSTTASDPMVLPELYRDPDFSTLQEYNVYQGQGYQQY